MTATSLSRFSGFSGFFRHGDTCAGYSQRLLCGRVLATAMNYTRRLRLPSRLVVQNPGVAVIRSALLLGP